MKTTMGLDGVFEPVGWYAGAGSARQTGGCLLPALFQSAARPRWCRGSWGVRLSAGRPQCAWTLQPVMQISEAARVSGVSARSLRYYEDEGLIFPGRCSNGFRDYCQSTLDRVLVIRELVESGLPVRLIKAVLPRLTDEPGPVCAEFLAEVADHCDRLAARIAILTAQQEALEAYLRQARRPVA